MILHPSRILRSIILTLLLSMSVIPDVLQAQDEQRFGEWNVYNATPQGTQMQLFADRVFVVNTASLSSIDLDLDPDSQVSYSRHTGLSGSTVQQIEASTDAHSLAIAYVDGTIDLMDSLGQVRCIPDLAAKPMSGDKTIYSLRECHGQLYVSGGFGVLVIDIRQGIVLQHYMTSYPVQFAFELDGVIYRYSDKRRLEYLDPGLNGSDPANWHTFADAPTLLDAVTSTTVAGRDFCCAIDNQGRLLDINRQGTKCLSEGLDYRQLFRFGTDILILGKYLTHYNTTDQVFTTCIQQPFIDCIDFLPAGEDGCYMLHSYYGILNTRFRDFVPGQRFGIEADIYDGLQPPGILTPYLGELHLTDNGIVGISRRSYAIDYQAANSLSGIISYIDNDNQEVRNIRTRDLTEHLPQGTNFQALQSFDIDPTDPSRYAIGSGIYGLFLFDNDSLVECLNGYNSVGRIDHFSPTFGSARVTALSYDDDGNLFIANSMQDTLLRCLTKDGAWLKFPHAGMTALQDARRILIPRFGNQHYKWVLNDCFYRKSRVGIYDDGGTLTQPADDQTAYFTVLVDQDNNQWEPNYIYDLCEDRDGKVWVLTNLGPFVIDDPASTFRFAQANPSLGKVRRVKIPRNDGTNLADYLMEATQCSCMAIDNFNRKWIGTYGAGLYLMSPDCITEIYHFDVDNSPLLSNSILSLCYDAETGLIYVSCEGGVLTYQTDAIEGADDFSSVHCYPNPVRPEYSGELRIMGLMNDSQVTITNASGDLVYRTRSQGATATWDLRIVGGQRPDPGIYLIHAVDAQGHAGTLSRFLVL